MNAATRLARGQPLRLHHQALGEFSFSMHEPSLQTMVFPDHHCNCLARQYTHVSLHRQLYDPTLPTRLLSGLVPTQKTAATIEVRPVAMDHLFDPSPRTRNTNLQTHLDNPTLWNNLPSQHQHAGILHHQRLTEILAFFAGGPETAEPSSAVGPYLLEHQKAPKLGQTAQHWYKGAQSEELLVQPRAASN